MNDILRNFKALMDARGGAGHQFESTYNPAAKYGLQKPARDITLWGKPEVVETDNKFLNILNPNAFRTTGEAGATPKPLALGSIPGKGGRT